MTGRRDGTGNAGPGAGPGAPWGLRGVTIQHGGMLWLDAIDIDAVPGELTAVVGGDGAGKTTLLRTLVGVQAVDHGTVLRPSSREIGFVAARTGLYADLTVEENLEFSAAAYGMGRSDLDARMAQLLERMGLAGARDRLVGHLSGGMRQKLALAAAIAHRPRLLVLDEPTTGVDPVSRAELWHLLAGAAAEGAAIVVATTYLDEAERASRVLLIHEGRALGAGTPGSLVAAMPGALGVATSRPSGDDRNTWRRGRTWRVWARDGRLPAGVDPVHPDLEDVAVVAQLASVASTPAPPDRQPAVAGTAP